MDTTRIDLNLLVTLEALLAEQNVTKAAARLNLSQPAVSAQLNRQFPNEMQQSDPPVRYG